MSSSYTLPPQDRSGPARLSPRTPPKTLTKATAPNIPSTFLPNIRAPAAAPKPYRHTILYPNRCSAYTMRLRMSKPATPNNYACEHLPITIPRFPTSHPMTIASENTDSPQRFTTSRPTTIASQHRHVVENEMLTFRSTDLHRCEAVQIRISALRHVDVSTVRPTVLQRTANLAILSLRIIILKYILLDFTPFGYTGTPPRRPQLHPDQILPCHATHA